MKEKVVCFAGHRHDWQIAGIENKLKEVIEKLITEGYTIFYDGGKGAFDNLSAGLVINFKKKYPNIKIFKILTYYHHDKEKWYLPSCYDGSIFPELDLCYFKNKIKKRNEWMIDNCDLLVCYISHTKQSGAFATVSYAKRINKTIIYL